VRRAGDDQVVDRGATRRLRRLRPERARPARYSSRTCSGSGPRRSKPGRPTDESVPSNTGAKRTSTWVDTPSAGRPAASPAPRGRAAPTRSRDRARSPYRRRRRRPRLSGPPPAKPRRTPAPARPRRARGRPASAGAARVGALPDLRFRNDIGALGGIDRGIDYALAVWGSQRKWRLAIKRPAKPHSARDATSAPTRPVPPPETSEV